MDQEFIREMLRKDLNRVKDKGDDNFKGKGPQEKGTAKLADTST